MTNEENPRIVERIREHPFFRGFDEEFVESACADAVERRFWAAEILFREGSPAKNLFVVLEGKVGLEVGSSDRPELTVQTVGPGEVIGWSWLVPPHRWRFDARALKPTLMVALDAEHLRHTLSRRPEWGYQFMIRFLPVLAERLENTRIQLLDLHAR